MNHFTYKPSGVCSRMIDIDMDGDTIVKVTFTGGCSGNTQGVAKLAVGRKADEIAALLEGIPCRGGTSCPDQLSRAIRAYHD